MGLQTLYSEGPGELASDSGAFLPAGSGDWLPDEPECAVRQSSSSWLVEADDDGSAAADCACCCCGRGVAGGGEISLPAADGDEEEEHPSCEPRDCGDSSLQCLRPSTFGLGLLMPFCCRSETRKARARIGPRSDENKKFTGYTFRMNRSNTWRRRAVKELGALEDVLVALRGEHRIVVGQVVPHEAVLVAPGDSIQPGRRDQTKADKGLELDCEGVQQQDRSEEYLLQDQEYMEAMPFPRRTLRRLITSAAATPVMPRIASSSVSS